MTQCKSHSKARFLTSLAVTAVAGLFAAPAISHAAMQCEAMSPENRVALVELYTSEGCSSCPPADKWLSALSESGLSKDKVLPLALHVDYWDYIGWKDRFADPGYTERQRQHATRNSLRSIYTPQVVTNGQDTRNWYRASDFLRRVEAINQQRSPVTVNLSATSNSAATVQVNVSIDTLDRAAMPSGQAVVHLVMYENALLSDVNRGENAGRNLAHDRVVRHWAKPQRLGPTSSFERVIPLPADTRLKHAGLAAFVQAADGEIIQAADCRLSQSS